MKASQVNLLRRVFTILGTVTLLLVTTAGALADVRVEGGGDVPFYARIGRYEDIYHTDDWAVIVFYRPATCIPTDFNLLDFFDIPGAFSCNPTTTDGFTIWKNGPDTDFAPMLSEIHGLGAVPVWFVPWPALQDAIADDVLTISELASLQPLIGYASSYKETLRPTEAEGVNVASIEFNASGTLEDGRSFQVEATAKIKLDSYTVSYVHTRIAFK